MEPWPLRVPLMFLLTLQPPERAPLRANPFAWALAPSRFGTNKGRLLPRMLWSLSLAWDDGEPSIFPAGRGSKVWKRRGPAGKAAPCSTHHFPAGEGGQRHVQDGGDAVHP